MGEPRGFLVVPIGYNPSDDLRALELDADDNLKVVFAAAAKGLVGGHGWISGAWQKNPLAFGFSGGVIEALQNTALAAGTNDLAGMVVPAGEIWVITNASIRYDGTVPTFITMLVSRAPDAQNFQQQLAPVSTQWYQFSGNLVLIPGDKLIGRVSGATLNDDLFFKYLGYRVDIDQ